MRYHFNSAKKLVERDIRPRLFFGPDDIPVIREGLDFPEGKRLWKAFKERAGKLTDMALSIEDMTTTIAEWNKTWDRPGTKIIFGLNDIAALACLDNNADALEACRRVLNVCPEAEKLAESGGRKRTGYQTGFYLAPAYDLIAPQLSPDERSAFCRWSFENVIYRTINKDLDYKIYFSPGANIPIVGMASAFLTWLALLGDKHAPRDATLAPRFTAMLEAVVGGSIGLDGYPMEDIGYGTAIAGNLGVIIECARRLGIIDIDKTMPRYKKFGNAILHFVQPWGNYLSNTGDHGDDFKNREFILPRLAESTGNPALLWLWQTLSYNHGRVHPQNSHPLLYNEACLGKDRQIPATLWSIIHAPLIRQARHPAKVKTPTSFRDRTRGIVSMRSGWNKDDTFIVFDSSQRSAGAQGHHHASAGHFSLSALGEYFSIDTGRYNNAQSCHSVILINKTPALPEDGEWKQVDREGRLFEYEPHPFVDTAAADSTQQHMTLKAERRIGLVKGREAPAYAWIMDDINAGNKINTFDWQMQCAPESVIQTRKDGATVTGFEHGNMLDVQLALPLFPGNRKSPDAHRIDKVFSDIAHPSAKNYLKKLFESPAALKKAVAQFSRPADMIHGPVYERPRLVLRFSGWNGRCLALLVPRKKGTPQARVTQLPAIPGTIAVQIRFKEVTDTIIVSFDHPLLQAGNVDERGLWCVVRQRNSNGKILKKAVGSEAI